MHVPVPVVAAQPAASMTRKRTRAGFDVGFDSLSRTLTHICTHAHAQLAQHTLHAASPTKKPRVVDHEPAQHHSVAMPSIPPQLYSSPLPAAAATPAAQTSGKGTETATAPAPSGRGGRMPKQREWRQKGVVNEFKMAMDILDEFKLKHGGKLPSLRAVMKMLKVGFPKAHEILDAYALHCGVTVSFSSLSLLSVSPTPAVPALRKRS